MFFKIDSALLVFFEKVAHCVQRNVGKDNFWVGWLVFWLRGMISVIVLFFDKKLTTNKVAVQLIGLIFAFMFMQLTTKFVLDRVNFRSSTSKLGVRNPLEHMFAGRLIRAINMLFVADYSLEMIVGFTTWQYWLDAILRTAMWYFFSCTPLPPGESKLFSFLGSLQSVFQRKGVLVGARL
jgi:hypothetical protein